MTAVRLIDAELLEDQFGISDADILTKEEIRFAPTVNAVPVVRCKDCKDWEPGLGGIPICRKTNKPMSPNGFCSIGDRKEAADG